MPSAEDRALDTILSTGTGERRRSASDAATRQAIPGDAVLWRTRDGCGAAAWRICGEPQAGAAADAGDGHRGDLPKAEYQPPASGTQGASLSVARYDDRECEPAVVRGHHLHSDGQGVRLSGGGDGLVQPASAGVAAVDWHGDRFLRRSAPGKNGT